MDDFATRKDLAELRMELKADLSGMHSGLKQDISDLRAEFQVLKVDVNLSLGNSALILEKSQKEQLRWIIGAMLAIFSLSFSILMAVLKIF